MNTVLLKKIVKYKKYRNKSISFLLMLGTLIVLLLKLSGINNDMPSMLGCLVLYLVVLLLCYHPILKSQKNKLKQFIAEHLDYSELERKGIEINKNDFLNYLLEKASLEKVQEIINHTGLDDIIILNNESVREYRNMQNNQSFFQSC